jgi:hypothetical protein
LLEGLGHVGVALACFCHDEVQEND